MSEAGESSGDPAVARNDPSRLMGRALRERWGIPGSLPRPLVERLGEIIRDPTAPHRLVLSAASVVLAASKINLANIDMTMKVKKLEELEARVTKVERMVALHEANNRSHG
jgi:hypothetical protein